MRSYQNMNLEIVSQFVFESNEITFEKLKTISLSNVFVHFTLIEIISDKPKNESKFCALFGYCLKNFISIVLRESV